MSQYNPWRRLEGPNDVILGQTVRDRMSGMEGIAGARIEYLTGCTQIAIAQHGLTADGSTKEWRYFDWQRLEVNTVKENEWADVLVSEHTQRHDGAGEAPVGRY